MAAMATRFTLITGSRACRRTVFVSLSLSPCFYHPVFITDFVLAFLTASVTL
jgi:hypothetical protein